MHSFRPSKQIHSFPFSFFFPSPFSLETDDEMDFVMRYTLSKILLHLQTFSGRKRILYGDRPFGGEWQQPLLSAKLFSQGERCHWYPRGLIRHPSPTLGTCLIKTCMPPFLHWDVFHSLQATGILGNRNHLHIKCCGLMCHPMLPHWFYLKWNIQFDHSGTILFLVSQDRYWVKENT